MLSINSPQPGDGNYKPANIYSWFSNLSINSPQPGDGNRMIGKVSQNLHHPTFDQLSPTWGWKRFCSSVGFSSKPTTFDQLSPTWGWKLNGVCTTSDPVFNILSINSPQPGDGNLSSIATRAVASIILSINSPQPGDGNLLQNVSDYLHVA